CEGSPCVPSRASFISGRFAINHGALTHWGPGGEFWSPGAERYSTRYPFFTRYLREAGYKTVTISSFGDRHQAWWFFAGWNEIYTHTLKRGNEDANEVNAAVLPWIEAHGKEDNYFLHIQYWDPHGFYTCPDEFAEQFADQPAPIYPDEATIQAQQTDFFPRSAHLFHWAITPNIPKKMPLAIHNRNDFVQLINGYDGGIAYMDWHVGQILEAYRKLGIEDEVCFIISADHGESFGEQGIYMEHGMATETVHHVPLIVRAPGLTPSGSTCNAFVYNVDVMATIVEFVGLPIPEGWDGQSLLPAWRGQAYEGRDRLVLEHGLYACQRSVRDHRWFFIRTYDQGLYDFPAVTLYDMLADPHETTNVAADHPDVVREMDHHLADWVQANRDKHGVIPDPMEAILETGPYRYLTPDDWIQRLRELGMDEAADRLAARKRSIYA
ncbi:MAG: sulfatase-like hydrolase/transferase, partial [Alicyclobacillus sp.]|nr:sulfatase-like hydrolase/transferase [Alicyclobacillus sp.]